MTDAQFRETERVYNGQVQLKITRGAGGRVGCPVAPSLGPRRGRETAGLSQAGAGHPPLGSA